MKPVIVSGIQPTGKLHLGNYLGALKHFVELQNSGEYSCYFFIADLHSLTIDFSPKEKREQILNVALDYLAAGLDPKKSVIFQQSAVPAHAELTWLLNTITPFGELRRMTQFKEKMGVESFRSKFDKPDEPTRTEEFLETAVTHNAEVYFAESATNVGLFDYPVLMASDILLYDAKAVPVGHDQLQHLELTRTLARKFNKKFGKTFVEPKPLMTNVERLMSLDDPLAKMSKSRPAGCIFIDDEPTTIKKKVMGAVTDSEDTIAYDPERRGMANLLELYAAMSGRAIPELVETYRGKGYADFKRELAEVIVEALALFQKKKEELSNDRAHIERVLEEGNAQAKETSEKKLALAKKKMGLI